MLVSIKSAEYFLLLTKKISKIKSFAWFKISKNEMKSIIHTSIYLIGQCLVNKKIAKCHAFRVILFSVIYYFNYIQGVYDATNYWKSSYTY